MGSKEIRKEFEDFITELSIEICTKVCLDKIIEINEEFKKNNKKLNDITSGISDTLNENRRHIEEINLKNHDELHRLAENSDNAVKNIASNFAEFLVGQKNHITEMQVDTEEKFKGTYDNFSKLFEKGFNNQIKLDENNSNIKVLTENVTKSNELLRNAMLTIDNSNKEHLSRFESRNEALFNVYNTQIQKLNDSERNKFVESISEAIIKEKNELMNAVINNINLFSTQVFANLKKNNNDNVNYIRTMLQENGDIKKIANIEAKLRQLSDEIVTQKQTINIAKNKVEDMRNELGNNNNKINNLCIDMKNDINRIEKSSTELKELIEKRMQINVVMIILIVIFLITFFIGL